MAIFVRAALGIALPLAIGIGAVALAAAFVAPAADLEGMARGMIGPATWPKAMLYCAGASAVLLAMLRFLSLLAARSSSGELPLDAAAAYHEGRSLAAIASLLAYGAAIPPIGIAWATPLFIAAWLLLSGLRRPLLIALVSVLGTLGVLYLFVKLSAMPLDRGSGVFEQATVALYRLLGIY
ncbi:MAG: tripartite tricarboxylate transporter TctB family protein [Betaproteobacteria bacterium]